MHLCLSIAELVEAIAQNIEQNTDLVTMALICRAFYEPAMNMLWKELDGLEPIFCCLPESVYGYNGDSGTRVRLSVEFSRPRSGLTPFFS